MVRPAYLTVQNTRIYRKKYSHLKQSVKGIKKIHPTANTGHVVSILAEMLNREDPCFTLLLIQTPKINKKNILSDNFVNKTGFTMATISP